MHITDQQQQRTSKDARALTSKTKPKTSNQICIHLIMPSFSSFVNFPDRMNQKQNKQHKNNCNYNNFRTRIWRPGIAGTRRRRPGIAGTWPRQLRRRTYGACVRAFCAIQQACASTAGQLWKRRRIRSTSQAAAVRSSAGGCSTAQRHSKVDHLEPWGGRDVRRHERTLL